MRPIWVGQAPAIGYAKDDPARSQALHCATQHGQCIIRIGAVAVKEMLASNSASRPAATDARRSRESFSSSSPMRDTQRWWTWKFMRLTHQRRFACLRSSRSQTNIIIGRRPPWPRLVSKPEKR